MPGRAYPRFRTQDNQTLAGAREWAPAFLSGRQKLSASFMQEQYAVAEPDMTISTTDIENLLAQAMPDATITVAGGDGKFQVNVVSETFSGLNRVKRQQAIYRILNAHITSGAIHAVSMLLQTQDEADTQAQS
jgi:acid stress-induced BolA-like protein IbaG/YrbA